MPSEIKDLIEQINREGIEKAQKASGEIEAEAKRKAWEIIEKAKKDAAGLLSQAKEEISRQEIKEKALLAQSGRDLLLSLRQQINQMLKNIIMHQVGQCLKPEEIYKIISQLVEHIASEETNGIVVCLKEQDRVILEKEFLARLKQQIQKTVTLKSADEISAGFTISFDSGKTQFDFTDQSLAEYISASLNPKLGEILKGVS
ncbi:MAG: hypothetical protein MUF05_04425 [Candidatus Omnitrophica bacterium]|jgi:V/A-type H+-transporting ATPase subunit E|nr:hypothetical protein [Candidatus Omnitrophota bacterium]